MMDNERLFQQTKYQEQILFTNANNDCKCRCAKISLAICTCKYMANDIERWRICFKINNRSYDHLKKLKLKFIITPPNYKMNVYEDYENIIMSDDINEVRFDNLEALELKIIYMDIESQNACKYMIFGIVENAICTSNAATCLLSQKMKSCYQTL